MIRTFFELLDHPREGAPLARHPAEDHPQVLIIPQENLESLPRTVPLTASLVVLWHEHACLMVFNRFRQAWELPGGMLDPGESARDAAFRELAEESAQRPSTLDFVGVARIAVFPEERHEFLAVYRGEATILTPFEPNSEMSASTWWNPDLDLNNSLPIDVALARLCVLPETPCSS